MATVPATDPTCLETHIHMAEKKEVGTLRREMVETIKLLERVKCTPKVNVIKTMNIESTVAMAKAMRRRTVEMQVAQRVAAVVNMMKPPQLLIIQPVNGQHI